MLRAGCFDRLRPLRVAPCSSANRRPGGASRPGMGDPRARTQHSGRVCLLVVLSRVVPGLPLVVAANRDERFDRPATPMAILRAVGPRRLGGRDDKAGGTWLA